MYQLWEREVEEVRLTIDGQQTRSGGWSFMRQLRS